MLRSVGLRPTRQRIALGRLLYGRGDRHITAEVLHEEAVRARVAVSLATVYNTLHQFTDVGLLRQVAVDGSKAYFDTNASEHHHFFVEGEEALVDIPEAEVVLDQVLRIMLHARMQYGLERYEAEHPEVDILLIEPTRDDMRMFSYNIMRYSARSVVALYGYRSAVASFQKRKTEIARLLRRHGIAVRDPHGLPDVPETPAVQSVMGRRLAASLDILESKIS